MLGFLFGNYAGMYGAPISPVSPSPQTQANAGQIAMLQHRVDSLELACAALWKLLKDHDGFTDDQLKDVVQAIDSIDGSPDGKVTKQGGVCPHCQHRILSRTATKCLWCGAPLNDAPFSVGGMGINQA